MATDEAKQAEEAALRAERNATETNDLLRAVLAERAEEAEERGEELPADAIDGALATALRVPHREIQVAEDGGGNSMKSHRPPTPDVRAFCGERGMRAHIHRSIRV